MNRPIQFKAITSDGKWCFGFPRYDLDSILWVMNVTNHYSGNGIDEPQSDYQEDVRVIPETVCQSIELTDSNGKEACTGDLRAYKGRVYELICDGWRCRFSRNMVRDGENEDITIDEDVIYDSILMGTIHDKHLKK